MRTLVERGPRRQSQHQARPGQRPSAHPARRQPEQLPRQHRPTTTPGWPPAIPTVEHQPVPSGSWSTGAANYACGPDQLPRRLRRAAPQRPQASTKIARGVRPQPCVNDFRIRRPDAPRHPHHHPGRGPPPCPTERRRRAPAPRASPSTWDAVFGAHGYTVRSRLVGTAHLGRVPGVRANRHDTLSPPQA